MRQERSVRVSSDRRAQLVAAAALLAGAAYLGWRWGWTLQWHTLWLGLPLLVAETWALASAALFAFSAWSLTAREAGPAPPGRRVAVLIPTYNEPADILRPTILGALGLRYRPAPEVWVLDDGGREWVAEMCRELGVRYLSRPAPREHAKAGNLNYALTRVEADFLVIVDADHVAMPHFLERTLGYMADPEVAFVQSPQAFFNRSFQHSRGVGDPLLNEQSLFYDVICRGKDRDNACFWCGSSALVRREALLAVGGVATETVVEDTHTAMKLHQAGWKSVYHPEVLAVGLAPEEVSAFLTQRGRWASGCYQVLRRDNPLFARGLGLRQRLHYFSSVSHYLEGPQRLVGLLVPPLVLLTGTLPLSAPAGLYVALFLPQLVLVPLATRGLARGRFRFAESERYTLVRVIAYTKAAAALVRGGRVTFKVTPKGAATGSLWLTALKWQVALAAFALCAAAYQAVAQAFGLPGRLSVFAFAVTVFWSVMNAGLLGAAVWWAREVRHRRVAHRFPVRVQAACGPEGAGVPVVPATVRDLNPFGLSMRVAEAPVAGARVRIVMLLDSGPLEVTGTVARAETLDGGVADIGVRLDELPREKQDVILRWCFAQPFGPDSPIRGAGAPVEAPEPVPAERPSERPLLSF
ncbi:MAG TPA: glycosyltransferase [Gaiellaceae bacterium]|nr:glycosyltransferase [Gaiellaceae bacterium]